MKKFILLILFITFNLFSQNYVDSQKLKSNFTLKASREAYKAELEQRTKTLFKQPIKYINEKAWISLFKDLSLSFYKNDFVKAAFDHCYKNFGKQGVVFSRYVMEAGYAIYPGEWLDKIEEIYKTTNDQMLFGYAANILLRETNTLKRDTVLAELKKRFPGYKSSHILRLMAYDMSIEPDSLSDILPPMKDLLNHDFQKGKTVIYSFHRKDRSVPGLTIIKKADGTFVKNEDNTIFSVPQLALSVSELPCYVRSGNTPQGIYSVIGSYVSPTVSIGPSPNVLMRIPHEVSTKIFYHNQLKTKKWRKKDYTDLLPESWQNYTPAYESFYCGKMGRKLIVMHGGTDDLTFLKDKPYYPMTPTKGCLSAIEIWSEETGYNIKSDQVKLMNAFFSTKNLKGFLVVIDINNKKVPVTAKEVMEFLK